MGGEYCNLEVVTRQTVLVPGAMQGEGAGGLWLQWSVALKTKKFSSFQLHREGIFDLSI